MFGIRANISDLQTYLPELEESFTAAENDPRKLDKKDIENKLILATGFNLTNLHGAQHVSQELVSHLDRLIKSQQSKLRSLERSPELKQDRDYVQSISDDLLDAWTSINKLTKFLAEKMSVLEKLFTGQEERKFQNLYIFNNSLKQALEERTPKPQSRSQS